MSSRDRSEELSAAAWRNRQAALAEFGCRALASTDLDEILNEACVLVARGLEVPIAKILETLPDSPHLLFRAAIGIPPEIATPGVTRIPSGDRSAAGFALMTDEPVISRMLEETRFRISEVMRRTGSRVSANVLIRSKGPAFGVLEVDSAKDRIFTKDDLNFLQTYANLLAAAVDRQRAGAALEAHARERETLMRELQHRMKNDLQLMTALLTLEARQAESAETQARLERIRTRIDALRLVHERLFVSRRIGQADLADYLRELCLGRMRMSGLGPEGEIRLDLQLAELSIDRDRAVSLGLIANEFITNSLKYAFPMGSGIIRVILERLGPDRARLALSDDGIGLPARQGKAEAGMGMNLIGMLAQQIGAETEWDDSRGTRFTLTFPTSRR